jgi:cytidylate kinase
MIKNKFIVAVDGASGTGKSTICKLVACEFDLSYLDTGAIYRSVALVAREQEVPFTDDNALKKICQTLPLRFEFVGGTNHVLIGTRDVTDAIRTPEISMAASKVSAVAVVRASLLDMQRRLPKETKKKGTIVDGRDMCTVVFPDADVKIFLSASDEVRATRRYKELKEKGMDVEYTKILEETIQRDRQDSQRAIAPLRKADDAVEVDTDKLDINGVKDRIIEITRKKLGI